ncbi:MAG: cytochrome o ubiquinol oxidase subunit III [Endozoicomonadaceae bacterium]|nr:cytochrome o ubiquinol oxidase subunit III [Endozoicomonadaceae bacterium]
MTTEMNTAIANTTNMQYVSHHHHNQSDTNVYGFWVYIMSDCILFACLFATFAVLHNNTYGGPSAKELFSLPFVFVETMALLTSSFTCGLMMLALHHNKRKLAFITLALTFLLGASFVFMELKEFHSLVAEGHDWQRSAFLSSFFTLVGTHGLHVSLGLLWLIVLAIQLGIHGINNTTMTKMRTFSLFWHFLDIIWILLFTIVYLVEFI